MADYEREHNRWRGWCPGISMQKKKRLRPHFTVLRHTRTQARFPWDVLLIQSNPQLGSETCTFLNDFDRLLPVISDSALRHL